MNDTERDAYETARDEIVDALNDARQHVDDAVERLRDAADISRAAGFPYWLHGQIDAYTAPMLQTFADDSPHQPGAIGSFLAAFEDPDNADYIPNADEIDDDDTPPNDDIDDADPASFGFVTPSA